MKKILVVGQTPPPYGGQAMMIKYMLDAKYENVKLYHVRMAFSKSFDDRGKFSFQKILHLFNIVLSIWKIRILYHPHIIYYPPSSAPKVALLRDVIILGCTRFLFKKTIFHFHAAGLSEELPKYNSSVRKIAYEVLSKPDIAITSSSYNPKDGEYLHAKKVKILPLGIPDLNKDKERTFNSEGRELRILFMGLLNSTKGEGYIVEALNILAKKETRMHLYLAGRFQSEEYQRVFFQKVNDYGLERYVHYKGVVSGKEKKELFLSCDIMCFPSFFSSESFGLVLLEGMMYQMPLIATRWRGIQSLVKDGENGYLVDIRNAQQIAEKLILFNNNRSLMKAMGMKGRKMFEENYTVNRYVKNLNELFNTI